MRILQLIIVWACMAASLAFAANDRFYRYTEANGTVVINSTISPERAAQGYDILDGNGRLLERVAPALTGDELSEHMRRQELEKQRQSEAKKQENYDISLLQRYSFVSDIEAEQKRQVAQLNTRAAILRGNLNGFRVDLEKAYEQAANNERQNKPIGDNLKKRIAGLEERISATEEMLNSQLQEIDNINNEYLRAIERFKELEVRRGRRAAP